MIQITLPIPPSTNGAWFNRAGGRTRTPAYNRWRTQAAFELKLQRPPKADYRASVEIEISDKARGDADNRIKPVLDLLVDCGVIEDDSKQYVKKVSSEWMPIDACKVSIRRAEQ